MSTAGPNPSGLCMCGCGQRTKRVRDRNSKLGYLPGQYRRYVFGHQGETVLRGENHPKWLGRSTRAGYVYVWVEGRYVAEHIHVAQIALGKPLPAGAVVHHVNGDPGDNRPNNLVICEGQSYHQLIHQRQRALDACGHAGWRLCTHCKKYDAPENLSVPTKPRGRTYHRACERALSRRRRARMAC